MYLATVCWDVYVLFICLFRVCNFYYLNIYVFVSLYFIRYPETAEVFKSSGLSGIWDPQQAGKRMKLPTPKTWETQISLYGNTPTMWEGLIGIVLPLAS